MRIIGGDFARLRFDVPKGLKLRPTTDMAKEALFSTLSSIIKFDGIRVLDLFSGTGSIGLEFISRGAELVYFVDKKPRHIDFIKSTVNKLNIKHKAQFVVGDVTKFLSHNANKIATFDVIFADPPYELPVIPSLPDIIFSSSLLSHDGLLVIEHPNSISFESTHPNCIKHKNYSAVNFSFFRQSNK